MNAAELYQTYRGTVFSVAYCCTDGNVAESEDLVQETFVKALTHEVPTDHPDRWLRKICLNLARDRGRHAAILRWERLTWNAHGEPSRDVADPHTPEGLWLAREARVAAAQELAARLAPLAPLQRQALVWALQGVPHMEIAARQGRSRIAIKSAVHRARQIAQASARPAQAGGG